MSSLSPLFQNPVALGPHSGAKVLASLARSLAPQSSRGIRSHSRRAAAPSRTPLILGRIGRSGDFSINRAGASRMEAPVFTLWAAHKNPRIIRSGDFLKSREAERNERLPGLLSVRRHTYAGSCAQRRGRHTARPPCPRCARPVRQRTGPRRTRRCGGRAPSGSSCPGGPP